MTRTPPEDHPRPGPYRHYKGGRYTLLATARHSETEEWLVVYRADADASLWVRPLPMWRESVIVRGRAQPRFAPVTEPPDSGPVTTGSVPTGTPRRTPGA